MARPYVHQRDGVVFPTVRCVQIGVETSGEGIGAVQNLHGGGWYRLN